MASKVYYICDVLKMCVWVKNWIGLLNKGSLKIYNFLLPLQAVGFNAKLKHKLYTGDK